MQLNLSHPIFYAFYTSMGRSCLLLSLLLGTDLGYSLLNATNVNAQLRDTSRTIPNGTYWIGGTGMALVVKGKQYYYSDETGQTPWKPVSRLKYIKDGVVFGEAYYWCLSTLPGAGGVCSPLGWENPRSAQEASCINALSKMHRKLLETQGIDTLNMTSINVAAPYPDYPSQRPDGYDFLMVGRGGYDILASDQLMAKISTAIITDCPTVSTVSFSAYPEGQAIYGLVNGKVQLFACYEAYNLRQSANPKPPWGYQGCL